MAKKKTGTNVISLAADVALNITLQTLKKL